MKMYKMIIRNKDNNSILHIENNIKEIKIDDYVNWFYNHSLQNYATYQFELIKGDELNGKQ